MLKPVRTAAPAVPVVSFDEADQWLHLDGVTEEKALVESLLAAATSRLDGWSGILGRCLVNQTWQVKQCDWPACGIIRLPFPDVSAATVTYFDADNAEQTVAGGLVAILSDARGSFIRLSDDFSAPALFADRDDAVQVTFTAGYGAAASAVPSDLRIAILLMAAHWFRNREAAGDGALAELPLGAQALIAPYRLVGV